ncbi:MAG: 3-deoxy-7-phosphoheptulonate synthase [Verrucomicrobiota bacterium]
MKAIHNVNIKERVRLVTPKHLKDELPLTEASTNTVFECRETIKRILKKEDPRLLVVIGPCSIHDPVGAMDYAQRLNALRNELRDRMEMVMRVYFEKPRTTVGWKGLIDDPHLDGTHDIEEGLHIARRLLLDITNIGMPTATEFLDPIIPQYTAELVSWASIGARTTESQTHRQMASGLSMPIGYKNSTEGEIQVAVDAMKAAYSSHSFVGMDQDGITSIFRTTGNPYGHVILRGGRRSTNYDEKSLHQAEQALIKAGLPPAIMVDCSHANSAKQPARQEIVWQSVLEQRARGNKTIIGMMIESNIHEGCQPIPQNLAELRYGISITDPCIDWPTTERILRDGYKMINV